MGIPIPVTVQQPGSTGGLLPASGSLPAGWERGIAFLDPNCLLPVTMGECPSGEGLKPTQRPESAIFRPISAIMAVECSAMSNLDVSGLAETELDRVRDFALARELLTADASRRDANPNAQEQPDGNPSLAGSAVDLGEIGTATAALGCLEATLNEANAGRGAVILAPLAFVTQAFAEGALWRDGARWRTAAGSTVVGDAGFDGRAPSTDPEGDSIPPLVGDALYAYAVTSVWAGVGARSTYGDVNRAVNTASARAEDLMMAAFSPCAVFAAAAANVTRCYSTPTSV